jgi:dienelactone hydrolase
MKSKLIILILLSVFFGRATAQNPEDIYKKPLKEVLTDIQKKYNVKLQYSESLVKDVNVLYATWRYRSDIETTLQSILMPLDMVFQKTGENSYQISKFAYYQRTPEEGKKHLEKLLASYPTLALWESRKAELRSCFLVQLRLSPFPKKTPLNPIVTSVRKYDGYTVENIAIETIPGVWLCGSLYKPSKGKGPFPVVLNPYGHFSNPDTNMYGRYRPDMQYRCATLARMGAVAFNYDMFAWGESRLQFASELHRTGLAHTMQTLNSLRALDYLTSLPFVDSKRIGITGASGGGSQSFLATALDDRITVSVPVVMVSSWYYGGCPCESGMPLQSCTDLMTYNVLYRMVMTGRKMYLK